MHSDQKPRNLYLLLCYLDQQLPIKIKSRLLQIQFYVILFITYTDAHNYNKDAHNYNKDAHNYNKDTMFSSVTKIIEEQ